MIALTIKQPFAWCVVQGLKPVENRDWSTAYRGPLLIHAGKSFDVAGLQWIRANFPEIELPETYELGGIIGRVEQIDCVTRHPSRWFRGKYGHVYQRATVLPYSPCRGMPGFFHPVVP